MVSRGGERRGQRREGSEALKLARKLHRMTIPATETELILSGLKDGPGRIGARDLRSGNNTVDDVKLGGITHFITTVASLQIFLQSLTSPATLPDLSEPQGMQVARLLHWSAIEVWHTEALAEALIYTFGPAAARSLSISDAGEVTMVQICEFLSSVAEEQRRMEVSSPIPPTYITGKRHWPSFANGEDNEMLTPSSAKQESPNDETHNPLADQEESVALPEGNSSAAEELAGHRKDSHTPPSDQQESPKDDTGTLQTGQENPAKVLEGGDSATEEIKNNDRDTNIFPSDQRESPNGQEDASSWMRNLAWSLHEHGKEPSKTDYIIDVILNTFGPGAAKSLRISNVRDVTVGQLSDFMAAVAEEQRKLEASSPLSEAAAGLQWLSLGRG